MTRKIATRSAIVFGAFVAIGSIGQWQVRAQWEGRRPGLNVMKQLPSDLGLTYQSFEARNPEGTRIAGWWLPACSPVASILMVHGFGQNKAAMLERAAIFIDSGFNVALIDLRARGESGGDRADIGPGAAYDVLAAVDALRAARRGGDLPFVGYGLSHGARAVLFAAAKSPARFAAVIAEAPPFSIRDGLRRQTGLPWVPAVAEGDLPGTFAALRNYPVLLLFGDHDPEISDAEASTLMSSNRHAASSVDVFANTGHGVFRGETRDQYRRSITSFLNRLSERRWNFSIGHSPRDDDRPASPRRS